MTTTELILHRGSLLQHGELQTAIKIVSPEKISKHTLKIMLDLGRQFCDLGPYHLVAYTQFPIDILNQWQIPLDLTNVIYVSEAAAEYLPFSNVLLINPLLKAESVLVSHPEQCGSIQEGRVAMWIRRPKLAVFTSYLWLNGSSHPKHYSGELNSGVGMLQHEIDHLRGYTALDRPDQFIDFTRLKDKDDWAKEWIWDWGPYDPIEEMATISREWIIWDDNQKFFRIVDHSGKYLRDL